MKSKDTFNWMVHQDQRFDFGQEQITDIPAFASEPSEDLYIDTTMTFEEVAMYMYLLGWEDEIKGIWSVATPSMTTFTKEFDNVNLFDDGRVLLKQILKSGNKKADMQDKWFYTWRQLIEHLTYN